MLSKYADRPTTPDANSNLRDANLFLLFSILKMTIYFFFILFFAVWFFPRTAKVQLADSVESLQRNRSIPKIILACGNKTRQHVIGYNIYVCACLHDLDKPLKSLIMNTVVFKTFMDCHINVTHIYCRCKFIIRSTFNIYIKCVNHLDQQVLLRQNRQLA